MIKIGFVVYPNFQIMGLTAMSVFELANFSSGKPLYDVRLLSEAGGLVRNSLGFSMETEPFGGAGFDTYIVAGPLGPPEVTPAMVAFLRRAARRTRRVASICSGAFALAAAGVLDGRRATTHWAYARELAQRYPDIEVDEDRIFIVDGNIWTSAGMTAGLDLALAMLEADQGIKLAREVARKMVMYHRRAGGQSQFSTLLEVAPKSDRIQRALAFAREHLKNELSIEELADAAGLSPRQFSRVFHAETGQTPAKAVESLRLEAARVMMEEGSHPIESIAHESGFADRERMRRAFLRAFGQAPQTIKRAVRSIDSHNRIPETWPSTPPPRLSGS
jgi:transcriptional regulator GlxA family with amidase domain